MVKYDWSCEELTKVPEIPDDATEICIVGNNLTTLTGVDFKNVTKFDCSGNSIETLVGVDFMNITVLICYDNRLTSLVGVDFKNITEFDCFQNDIEMLASVDFKKITTLYCNRLKTLEGIDFKNVIDFSCWHNHFTTLAGVDFKNIVELDFYGTKFIRKFQLAIDDPEKFLRRWRMEKAKENFELQMYNPNCRLGRENIARMHPECWKEI